jgi:predicted transcriptional regulator YdeE
MTDASTVELAAFTVLGLQERIQPMAADYTAIWARYEARHDEIAALGTGEDCYGVYFGTEQEGLVDHLACKAVPPGVAIPEGLTLREVAGGMYAVFECSITTIGPTWQAIFGEWLPAAAYAYDSQRPSFERFPPGCHGGEARVSIYAPVKPKA